MNGFKTLVRYLPTKLPNAITIHDSFGTNTILPLTLCKSAEHVDAILTFVAAKWRVRSASEILALCSHPPWDNPK
uniref:Glutathione peroxidase n=1 Tax=Ganoderma boninense TaxID=34458 RepID=A0A5K1JT26_9APHY|nr:Glutathione peroxidase [Ganoderma boninense]